MKRPRHYSALLLLTLLSFIPARAECDCTQEGITGIPQGECEALQSFYHSAGGAQWFIWIDAVATPVPGWRNTSPVADWHGITVVDGHVAAIDFDRVHRGTGILPPELGNLPYLKRFSLDGEPYLNGGIPPEFGNLVSLEELTINGNRMNGTIAPELGNLLNLKILDLSRNQLSGDIPPELGNLSNLTGLNLRENRLSGNIPPELGNLSNLVNLNLSSNELTGRIPPELGGQAGLVNLYLNENELEGPIPPELGNLVNLKYLRLSENRLEGSIPPEICAPPGLTTLDLSSNRLEGEIPPEIGGLMDLKFLRMNQNRLTGQVPPELGSLVGLLDLDLEGNRLSGAIPPEIMNLVNLYEPNLWFRIYNSSIGYNLLHTDDPEVQAFMDTTFRSWSSSQTVAAESFSAQVLESLPWTGHPWTGQFEESNRIRFFWDPILFQEKDGGYEVCIKESADGPCLAWAGITPDKEDSSLVVSGLNPGTWYFFDLFTKTFAHERNQNSVTSRGSGTISIQTGDTALTAFPLWETKQDAFTGLAFSNYGASDVGITLTAYDEEGEKLNVPMNPSAFTLDAGKQVARLGTEMFGVTDAAERVSWLEAASDQLVGSFFTFGSSELRMLDGAVTRSSPSRKLYFSTPLATGIVPRYGEAEEVNVALINPFDAWVRVKLSLIRRGGIVGETERVIAAKGMMLETGEELFGDVNIPVECFMEVETTAGPGVIGFARTDYPESGTTFGLNAWAPSSAETLYSAQLASGPGVAGSGMETHIRLVNTTAETREITFKAIAEDGTLLAEPAVRRLLSRRIMKVGAWTLFEFEGDSAVGSLVVEVDSGGVVGDVIFTPYEGVEYAAAMPLQTRPVTEAVFNHIADSEDIYTGLAFFNPGREAVQITLLAKRGDGTVAGTKQLTLGPGERISRTLKDPDMLPETASLLNGFISVAATQPIICQQLYGGTDLQFLAAVPPTTSCGTMFDQADEIFP